LPEPRFRVLAISSHPIQYLAPLLRRMAHHPQLDMTVAYCTLRGIEPTYDPHFGTTVQWDIPLLDGYLWKEIPNRGSGGESFWGLNNPGLWNLIREGKFDAVLCFLSYRCVSFWISYLASRLAGAAFIFGTDASSIVPRSGAGWKLRFKKVFWPFLFSLADQNMVPSSSGREMMLSLGRPSERVTLVPSCVDNDWWIEQSQRVDREAVRSGWGATPGTCVLLFCGKIQPWKRPLDLLHAFAKANLPNALLVFAGDGAQRPELESEAARLGISGRVRFLGFLNQSQLPPVYTSADLMVIPSEYEPFALVVNEAYCCGCAVVASDRVGAARNLVAPVDPRLVYPSGDVDTLSAILAEVCVDRNRLSALSQAAKLRIASWSPQDTVIGMVTAITAAVQHRRRK
jgi:glycosyltransferase involved in cell wall biosynthesis